MNFRSIAKTSLIAFIYLAMVCGCGPLRPIKSGILAIEASGWEERYGIKTEDDLGKPSSIPKLILALEDENERVRFQSVNLLTKFGEKAKSAIPKLKLLSLTDKNSHIQLSSILAITKIAGSEDETSLYVYENVLSDKSRRNRGMRQGVLSIILREEIYGPKLIDLIKKEEETERYQKQKKAMLAIIIKSENRKSNPPLNGEDQTADIFDENLEGNSFITTAQSVEEANSWVDKSYKSIQKKQWAEVIRTASVAISLNPENDLAYSNRASGYAEKGFFEEALEDSNAAIDINPENLYAYNNRGVVYKKTGKEDLALADFRLACEAGFDISCQNFKEIKGYFPYEEVQYLLSLSHNKFKEKNYKEVVIITKKLIAIDPKNETAFSNSCAAKAMLGLLDEAKQDCLKSIEINPDYGTVYNNYGYVFEKLGKIDEAILYYEISCGLNYSPACKELKMLKDSKPVVKSLVN